MNKFAALSAFALVALATAAPVMAQAPVSDFGPHKGAKTVDISGSISDLNDSNNTTGNVNFGIGYFFTNAFEARLGEQVTISAGGGSTQTDNFTGIQARYHFVNGAQKTVPYVGVGIANFHSGGGGSDTSSYELLGGVDFFLRPQQAFFAELDDNQNTSSGSKANVDLNFGLRFFIP